MKVVGEAPTGCSKRLIVTEHGIPYRGRPPGERSRRSSRRSDDLKSEQRKAQYRAKGDRGTARTRYSYAKCGEAQGREAGTGERDAGKLARPVRGGADGKGLAAAPRR